MDCKVTKLGKKRVIAFEGGYTLTDNGAQSLYVEVRKKRRSVPMGKFADCVTEMSQRSGVPCADIMAAIKKADKPEKKEKK